MIDNSSIIIANSIIWNEESNYEFTSLPNNSVINADAYYSNLRILDNTESTESFSIDPLFINYTQDNFNLSINSPCINSGTNFLEINDNIIIDMDESEYYENMPDMGYFEHYGEIVYGDVNIDNIINVLDIILIVNLIIDGLISDEYNQEAADLTQDGTINILDIIALVNLINDN